MEDFGSIRWQLVLSLMGAWILITLVLVRGIASYGKAAYFITLSPYVILTALIIYSAQLEGALDGIKFYLEPDWNKLAELTIWAQAASQILYSLSVGFGSQIILASYNKFTNNTFRDAVLISVCNSLTSIYAGFVVFSILGFLAFETNREVEDVVTEGIKMAFVAYPSAVLEMDVPPLWSFLFFFMLLNLALSSTCGSVENFIAFIVDEWPSLKKHKIWVLIFFNFLSFCGGLPFCFEGGIYLFTIFDTRLAASLLIGVSLEMVLVGWVYGIRNFLDNLKEMGMDFRLNSHGWRKCVGYFLAVIICIITPGALIFLTIQAWVEFEGMEFEGYDYPSGWEAFGWVLELTPVVLTFTYPLYLAVKLLRKPDKLEGNSMLRAMTSPNRAWYETDRSDGEGGGGGDGKSGGAANGSAGAKPERRRSIASIELSKM